MGNDSVKLTDILLNLKYDPAKICNCTPEYTVKTKFGKPHGVNLPEGYAQCEKSQADLTQEQAAMIQKIMDNQI